MNIRNKKGQFVKGFHPKTQIKKGDKLALGIKHTPEQRLANTQRQLGHHRNKGKSMHLNTGRTHFKKGMSPWNKGLPREQQPGYREDAKTALLERLRKSRDYRIWRIAVLERDNYICIWCGLTENLQADHIKKFVDYPELRFAIDNGRTLCVDCHRTTENYGNRRYKDGK